MGRVTVFSGGNTSGGSAQQVLSAARLFRAGHTPQEVAQILQSRKAQRRTFLCMTTLDYLRRNKRISVPVHLLGNLSHTKPIFQVQQGQIVPWALPRGSAAALEQMRQLIRDFRAEHPQARIIHAYTAGPGHRGRAATELLRQECQRLAVEETLVLPSGVVFSSFAGPNAYGFSIEPEYDDPPW